MTEGQKAAYVYSMAATAIITAAGMVAENEEKKSQGKPPTYSEQDFLYLIHKQGIHHNAVIEIFEA